LAYDVRDFRHDFEKSWTEFFKSTFFKILSVALFCTFLIVFYLATKTYIPFSEQYKEILQQKYIEVIIKSREVRIEIAEKIDTRPEKETAPISRIADIEQTFDITDESNDIFNAIEGQKEIENVDLYFEEFEVTDFLVAEKDVSSKGVEVRKIKDRKQYSEDDLFDDDIFELRKVTQKRKGAIYLEPIIEEKEEQHGWRNADEISIVMQNRERMIEYCYKKEAKNFSKLHGYVILRFVIMYSGIVDPASVEIVESTLYNKRIEKCIKGVMQRFRGFERLDESMGNVTVVQKFVFN